MDAPQSKAYEGPSGIGRDSNWLTNEDLVEGQDAKCTIESVLLYPEVKFQGGRTRANVVGLKFKGKQRVLLLNATNRKVLNKMFSNITKAWKGQEITLFVAETQMAGETVKCVRIRDRGSRVASAAEEFLSGDDEPKTPAREEAVELPDSWTEEQCQRFSEACSMAGVSGGVQARLLGAHAGRFDAVMLAVNKAADERAA